MIRAGDQYRIVELSGRSGVYEVDFRTYFFERPCTIFLRRGQYLDVISGDLVARECGVDSHIDQVREARVLFTHVYEVGRVDGPIGARDADSAIQEAALRWRRQRPLHPNQTELQTGLVLDLTELIGRTLPERRSPAELARNLSLSHQGLNRVTTKLTGKSVGRLLTSHRITEARRLLALSSRSVKEISLDVGYPDPAYFSRRFSGITGESPREFRKRISDRAGDPFVGELLEAVSVNLRDGDARERVADHFGLDPRSLNAKVKRHTGRSLQGLINRRRAALASELLVDGASVSEASDALSFPDPFTFSHFFRRETGLSPRQVQKVHVYATS